MWGLRLLLCVFLAGVSVRACRNSKEQFPPDVFPEDGHQNGISQSRKKRHVVSNPNDADHDLSDFFTKCMFENTGSFFTSWRAVVDFVLRDTRWFSASDEQFCKRRNSYEIPVKCWQDRFDKLVKLDSKLLPIAKECMQEYEWSKEAPIRGKRGVNDPFPSSSHSTQVDVCLGVSVNKFGSCLEDNLLTKSNLASYVSLKAYNQRSIDDFVSNHYTACRITSKYNPSTGNKYSEDCPSAYSSSFPSISQPQCLSTTFKEIVRTSSPLFDVTKTCIKKYSPDKCRNVNCWRQHEICHPPSGRCVCEEGYSRNNRGNCAAENKCMFKFCGEQNEVCDQASGSCVCRRNYVRNQRGDCVPKSTDPCRGKICGIGERCIAYGETAYCICLDGHERVVPGMCRAPHSCAGKNCGRHGRCRMRNGVPMCICNPGYTEQDGVCKAIIDACASVRCGRFMTCQVDPSGAPGCVCIPGYVPDPVMNGAGCKLPDPCDGVNCGPNGRCVNGRCVCNNGYRLSNGRCVPIDLCAGVDCGRHGRCVRGNCFCNRGYQLDSSTGKCEAIDHCSPNPCAKNMRCEITSQSAGRTRCVCLPGFVPDPNGPGCVRLVVNPCAGVNCGIHGICIRGDCMCNTGYQVDPGTGQCVAIDHCSPNPCAKNMRCEITSQSAGRTRCVCLPGFTPDPNAPGCVRIVVDPCARVNCGRHGRCVRGNCVCNRGYQLDSTTGQCVAIDHCSPNPCAKNMRCEITSQSAGRTRCVCLPGFVPDPNAPGCRRRNPCDDVDCPANSVCRNGNCDCIPGFRKDANGRCIRIDVCQGVRCETNMRCQNGNCVCLPNFVPNPNGQGCVRRGSCGGVTCPEHSSCFRGECVCVPPRSKDASGQCVFPDLCENFNCDQNEECSTNDQGLPVCKCRADFIVNRQGPGCIRDPCETLQCGPNSACVRGRCRCEPGFRENESGRCVSFDPCEGFCGENENCEAPGGRPRCFCKQGFILNEFRECVPQTSDPCLSVECERNMECRNGACFCEAGFTTNPNGNGCIRPPVRCGGRECDKNMVCQRNQCQCLDRHVPDSIGGGCEPISVDPCRNIECERNMECKNGRCECLDGFTPAPPGGEGCQRPSCPPNKVFNACPTQCPETCANRGSTTPCPPGCRNGVNCVCRSGFVERSSSDSTCVQSSSCPPTPQGACSPNPCKHEGTCTEQGSGFTCRCKPGYEGERCRRGCGEFCRNGRCVNKRCKCNTGFFHDDKGGCS